MLDALAAALRMTAAERSYLLTLAYSSDAGGEQPAERLGPGVDGLVQRLEPYPTLVKGRCWDVLAANPAGSGWPPRGTRATRT